MNSINLHCVGSVEVKAEEKLSKGSGYYTTLEITDTDGNRTALILFTDMRLGMTAETYDIGADAHGH